MALLGDDTSKNWDRLSGAIYGITGGAMGGRCAAWLVYSAVFFGVAHGRCADSPAAETIAEGRLVVPLPGDKLAELDGDELLLAAEEALPFRGESDLTPDQLLNLCDKLSRLTRAIGSDPHRDNPFNDFFEVACKRADDKQLDRLIGIFGQVDPAAFQKTESLAPLVNRWIQREVKAIGREHRRVELPDFEVALPDKLKEAPKDLADGWRKNKAFALQFEKTFPRPHEKIDAEANRKTFYGLVQEILEGGTKHEGDLLQYGRTGISLNLTDANDGAEMAMFVMLLRERRLDLAVAASIKVLGAASDVSHPATVAPGIIAFYQTCGVDWEGLYAGAEVDWNGEEDGQYVRAHELDTLAAYGGERGVMLLSDIAALQPPADRELLVHAVSLLIPDDPQHGSDFILIPNIHNMQRSRGLSASENSRKLCCQILRKLATNESTEAVANEVIGIASRSRDKELIPVVRALLEHSSEEIRVAAAKALRELGEDAPSLEERQVVFQILMNHEPLPAGTQLTWALLKNEGGGVSSTYSLESDGLLKLKRSLFESGTKAVKELILANLDIAKAVRFEKKMPPPAHLDDVTVVDIEAAPLEIILTNTENLNAPFKGNARISLHPFRQKGEAGYWRDDLQAVVDAAPSILIENVQTGPCEVSVFVDGAAPWTRRVKLKENGERIEARLAPGSDVHFKALTPTGEGAVPTEVLKDGQVFDADTGEDECTYQNLPCGNYVMKFVSKRKDENMKLGPDEIPFKERDIAFTVRQGSPGTIDLGEIRLDPLASR